MLTTSRRHNVEVSQMEGKKVAIINEECIGCGGCAGVCPVSAIAYDEAVGRYMVDPALCIFCTACMQGVCPVDAIHEGEVKA